MLKQILAKFFYRPAPIRQTQLVGSAVGQTQNLRSLNSVNACRCARERRLSDRIQTLIIEGTQISVNGIDMSIEKPSDAYRRHSGGVDEDSLCSTSLPGGGFFFKPFFQLPNLGGR